MSLLNKTTVFKAVYQGVEVYGKWVEMPDSSWLELLPKSCKDVGTDAIIERDLDKLIGFVQHEVES